MSFFAFVELLPFLYIHRYRAIRTGVQKTKYKIHHCLVQIVKKIRGKMVATRLDRTPSEEQTVTDRYRCNGERWSGRRVCDVLFRVLIGWSVIMLYVETYNNISVLVIINDYSTEIGVRL